MTIIVLTMTNIVLTMTRSVLEEFDLRVNFHIFTDNVVAPGTEKRTVRWCSGAVVQYGGMVCMVHGIWQRRRPRYGEENSTVWRREQYGAAVMQWIVRRSSDAVDSTEKQ